MATRTCNRRRNLSTNKAKQLILAKQYCQGYEDPDGFEVRCIDDFIGEGVFTTRSFITGDFLLEYTGNLISNYQKANQLDKEYGETESGCFMYFFKFQGKRLCIDGTNDVFRQGRMVNDAPKGDVLQNCEPKIVTVDEVPHLCFFASRDISKGEELRFDYGDSNLPWRKKSTKELNEADPRVPGEPEFTMESYDNRQPLGSNQTPRDEEMETEIESRVFGEQRSTVDSNNRQPLDGHQNLGDETIESQIETEPRVFGEQRFTADSYKNRQPLDRHQNPNDETIESQIESRVFGEQRSTVDSNNRQPLDGHQNLGDETIESQIETEPRVFGEQRFTADSYDNRQPLDRHQNPRDETIESDIEIEPRVFGEQRSTADSYDNRQPLDRHQNPRDQIMESEMVSEIVDESTSESNVGSEILPMLCSENVQIQYEFGDTCLVEDYDDDVLDPDYHPDEENKSDSENQSDVLEHLDGRPKQRSGFTSSSEKCDDIPVMTVEKRRSDLIKGQRDFKRKHICFVCEKEICDIPRHASVAHKDDDLVKAALLKPKGSKERRAIWKVFINKGAYRANIKSKAIGGELRISKRTGTYRNPDEYQPCIYCYGFFLKKDLWRHTKSCNASVFSGNQKEKNSIQANIKAFSATVNSVSGTTADSTDLLERFYAKMKLKDDAYLVVKQDRLMQLYTKSLLEEGKSFTDISWTVRLLAKLLLKARDVSQKTDLTWMELIDHVNWNILAAAIRYLAEFKYDKEKVTVGKANIGTKCGQGVKGLIAVFEGYALSLDDDFLLQKARKMMMNYEKEWIKIKKRCIEANKEDREDQEDNILPLTSDIIKLKNYCVDQIKKVSLEVQKDCNHQNYKKLQQLVLARLISFNARRAGEPGKLKLSQWQDIYLRKGIHKADIDAMPTEEKLLAERLRLGYVLGKGLKKVPVLFPDETVSAINTLVKHRASVISNPENPYVFGRLHKSSLYYRRGSDSIRQICNEAGLQQSSLITATQLRKYLSTTLQLIDMTEAELRWVTDHMGHTIDVHKRWYRMSNKAVELSKVANILVAAETGNLQKAHMIPFDDVRSRSMTANEVEPSTSLEPPKARNTQRYTKYNCNDLHTRNSPQTPGDEAMESDIEAEPSVPLEPRTGRNTQRITTDNCNNLHSRDSRHTPTNEAMGSDIETESPVFWEPQTTISSKRSITEDSDDLQCMDSHPTQTDDSMESDTEEKKGKSKKQTHRPWSQQEKTALYDTFSSFLVPNCRNLPGKRQITKAQANCKELKNRTWLNIKYQLKNMQQKLNMK